LDKVLDFLWSQWSALGVPGHSASSDARIIDPEALILLTCSLGRFDARLFDEMLDWINLHKRLVHVQRLKNMARYESFAGLPVLCAVGAWMTDVKAGVKWRRLMESGTAPPEAEPLFRTHDGTPLPIIKKPDPLFEMHGFLRDKIWLRKNTRIFDPEPLSNLLMRLRAFFGVNSRAEVMTYLLTHERAGAAEIAQATYYYKRTIYNALVEMRLSGLLQLWEWGSENLYSPKSTLLKELRGSQWISWAPFFRVIEQIWQFLDDTLQRSTSEQLLATDLYALTRSISPLLQKANLLGQFQVAQPSPNKDYVENVLQGFKEILKLIEL